MVNKLKVVKVENGGVGPEEAEAYLTHNNYFNPVFVCEDGNTKEYIFVVLAFGCPLRDVKCFNAPFSEVVADGEAPKGEV